MRDADSTVPPSGNEPTQPGATPTDMPPAVNVTPSPAPQPAATNPLQRLVIILLAVIVLLVGTMVTLLVARAKGAAAATPPSAQTILTNAANAKLTSATYTFTGTLGIQMSATATAGTSLTFGGSGAFTTAPMRSDTQFHIDFLGAQNVIEALADGNQAYIHAPIVLRYLGVTGADQTKWIQLSLGASPSTAALAPNQLYSHISQPTLIGSETVNGQDTWHVQGTLSAKMPSTAGGTTSGGATTGADVSMTPVTVDLWITKSTWYPVRIITQTKVTTPGGATTGATTSGAPRSASVNLTANFAAWNNAPAITPPPADQVIKGLPAGINLPAFCPPAGTATPTTGGQPCVTLPGGLTGLPGFGTPTSGA